MNNSITQAVERIHEELPLFAAERLVEEAEQIAGAAVALYVLELEGVELRRVTGGASLPERIEVPRTVGPDVSEERADDLRTTVETRFPGSAVFTLARAGRAFGVLVSMGPPAKPLHAFVRRAAAALELAEPHTDRFHRVRRARRTTPAAQLQDDLLPPRNAAVRGAEVAGSLLPAYDVGGDWFDWADNLGSTQMALGDAGGKGAWPAALSALGLSALRAARRDDDSLEGMALEVHRALFDLAQPDAFITAVIAAWESRSSTFSWITCGHPSPLLVQPDGGVVELRASRAQLPLGLLFERDREFRVHELRLEPGQRIILYSDGVSERRTAGGGLFGRAGIESTLAGLDDSSAAATATAIAGAVAEAAADPLQDDATVLVLKAT